MHSDPKSVCIAVTEETFNSKIIRLKPQREAIVANSPTFMYSIIKGKYNRVDIIWMLVKCKQLRLSILLSLNDSFVF